MSIATAVTWVFNFCVTMTLPAMKGENRLGPDGMLSFYGTWNLVGFLLVLLYVLELLQWPDQRLPALTFDSFVPETKGVLLSPNCAYLRETLLTNLRAFFGGTRQSVFSVNKETCVVRSSTGYLLVQTLHARHCHPETSGFRGARGRNSVIWARSTVKCPSSAITGISGRFLGLIGPGSGGRRTLVMECLIGGCFWMVFFSCLLFLRNAKFVYVQN